MQGKSYLDSPNRLGTWPANGADVVRGNDILLVSTPGKRLGSFPIVNRCHGSDGGRNVKDDSIRVASEREMDERERPIHAAFVDFLDATGLSVKSDSALLVVTFKTGNVHFAAKAIECIPADIQLLIIGTQLSAEEVNFLELSGRPIFTADEPFDNELSYELLMDHTAADFGWADADCFVVDRNLWDELLRAMPSGVANRAAFTYEPLGFAKPPLVVWNKDVRSLLESEHTSLNSYSPSLTGSCRGSPYAVSRIVDERQLALLRETLGMDADGSISPHEGLLDVYNDKRTISSTDRALARSWVGDEARLTGWVLDTPIMAQVALRAHGWTTSQVLRSNNRVSNRIIHPGASGYRDRMRAEGARSQYTRRWQLTDLLEVLLLRELLERGGPSQPYEQKLWEYTGRIVADGELTAADIPPAARHLVGEFGVDLDKLREDDRFSFIFTSAST